MSKRYEMAQMYTEKYRDQLHPCKICGNTDVRVATGRTIFNPRNVWSVCCATHNCDTTADFTSVRAAIKAWNSPPHV